MNNCTNYNSLMKKALFLAKEKGVTEQSELNKCIAEVFKNARRESYRTDEPTVEYITKH